MENKTNTHMLPRIGESKTHSQTEKEKKSQVPSYLLSSELINLFEKMVDFYRWKNVVLRGLVNGIFTALGASVGIALIFVFLTRIYSGLQDVPIVNDFMRVTGLDLVVEYTIQQSEEIKQDAGVTDKQQQP